MSDHNDTEHPHAHDHTDGHTHAHGKNEHSHSHKHRGHHHSHSADRAPHLIKRAIAITLTFMVVELAGGWIANSLALVSDAAHMLTDVGAMLLSLFALWIARRPNTLTMSFGYHRAEILGALGSGLLIWLISGVLIFEAFLRMKSPPEVQGPVVFVVATIGLLANLGSMWILNSAKNDNINIRAAYVHLLSDAIGSIGAIIAGLVLWLTQWRLIDPIITVIFAVLMLYSSWSLVKESIGVLMESTPEHMDPAQVKQDLQNIPTVTEAHDLHIWSVSSGKFALSAHLVAENTQDVLNEAHRILQEKYGIIHTTIQVEHPSQFQSKRCYDCVPT